MFEGGNAEKPYIIGAHYNGKQSSGFHTPGNDLKVIKTKSGHTVLFDDSKDKMSITILDKSGNAICLNTVKKNISISTLGTFSISAKNIIMNATESIILESDKQSLISNEIKIASVSKIVIVSNGKTEIKGAEIEHLTGGEAKSPTTNSDTTKKSGTTKKSEGKITKITLYDKKGKETKFLGDSNKIIVETKNMKDTVVNVVIKDNDTNKNIDFGNFFIPKDSYKIEIPYLHKAIYEIDK
ncbi:MAG TPA: hypothetical protein VF677_13020 [Flavobacterium sp.]